MLSKGRTAILAAGLLRLLRTCARIFQEHETKSHYMGKLNRSRKTKQFGAHCPLLIAGSWVKNEQLRSFERKLIHLK